MYKMKVEDNTQLYTRWDKFRVWLGMLLIGKKIAVIANCHCVDIEFFDARADGKELGIRPMAEVYVRGAVKASLPAPVPHLH